MFVVVKIDTESGTVEHAERCDSDWVTARSLAQEMIMSEYDDRGIEILDEAKYEREIEDSLVTLGYYRLIGKHRESLNTIIQVIELT